MTNLHLAALVQTTLFEVPGGELLPWNVWHETLVCGELYEVIKLEESPKYAVFIFVERAIFLGCIPEHALLGMHEFWKGVVFFWNDRDLAIIPDRRFSCVKDSS